MQPLKTLVVRPASCVQMVVLIYIVLGSTDSASGASNKKQIRDFADSYYQAVVADDEEVAFEHLAPDAWLSFEMDFGMMYPDYEGEFRADELGALDITMFESYKVISTDYVIDSVELTESGGVVHARVRQSYSWSGFDGTMFASETLTVNTVENLYLITRLESQQKFE